MTSRTEVPRKRGGSSTGAAADPGAAPEGAAGPRASTSAERWKQRLSFRNIGAVYVWIAIIILFSIWASDTFPTTQTAKTILNQNAISGLVALALVVPLSARVFDLSVGNIMGLSNVIVAWLLVDQGVSIGLAIILTIVAGMLLGLINAVVVVQWGIDSFIATLATGSLMAAGISMVTDDQSIIGNELGGSFGDIATREIFGVQMPVYVMLVVAAIIWYTLNYTVSGRRIYATGFNEDGARLTGIRTHRLRFVALIGSGVVAAIGGVLLASQVSSGSPNIGPPYLLDAFAAAFLGATMFGGRFNAWGTVIAVLLLGTGKTGLVLVGAPSWAPNMFSGAVLLFALGLGNLERMLEVRKLTAAGRRRAAETAPSGPSATAPPPPAGPAPAG
jgi:ribose transport system permease protein